jgi:hypothetical protein
MAATVLDVASMLPNKFQPKFKRSFVLAIEGIDAYIVKTSGQPSMTTEEVPIPWINSTRYVAGKTTFNTLAVTFHDPIAPSGAQQVMEWVRSCFDVVSGRAGYADFYKRDISLKILDPLGTVISLFDIKGAFCTEVNFGDLSYEDSGTNEISVTIRYDTCVLQY